MSYERKEAEEFLDIWELGDDRVIYDAAQDEEVDDE